MTTRNRITRLSPLLTLLGVLLTVGVHPGLAQRAPSPDGRDELPEPIDLDRAPGPVLVQLQRIKALSADRQWDDAVRSMLQLMQDAGNRLLPVAKGRYIRVRDYCHLQLTAWPPEALSLYRRRVDPLAEKWYRDGLARRDPQPLLQVVEDASASSWADDAFAALGEIAFEEADFDSACAYWEKILPIQTPAGAPPTSLHFPDTNLDLPSIRARLVLASILEGSPDRARDELSALAQSHPDARGPLGGREVNLVEALENLLAQSRDWPAIPHTADWLTFAGTPWRNKIAPAAVDVRSAAWRVPLNTVPTEQIDASPNHYPVLNGNMVLLNTRGTILALDVRTGKPAWGHDSGVVYHDEPASSSAAPGTSAPVTLTVYGSKLYARMGSSIAGQPPGSTTDAGCLVCLDLESEGRLLWKTTPDGPAWAFEGSPVCDGRNVYVAMRRSDIRPQAHVACFDAETGQRRWRRFVCAAETPPHANRSAENLLTLKRDTLYYNTNLGAVAALSTREGAVRWITLYPRVRPSAGSEAPCTRRNLTPCLVHRGMVLVAPADNPRIFALQAATGEILWQTETEVEDVTQLLGAAGDQLIASGRRLYWISLAPGEGGQINHVWPEDDAANGYGRGILAADRVYLPTRERIYIFDQASAQSQGVIDLASLGATGGNILVSDVGLLIATGTALIALHGQPAVFNYPEGGWGTADQRRPPLRGGARSVPVCPSHPAFRADTARLNLWSGTHLYQH